MLRRLQLTAAKISIFSGRRLRFCATHRKRYINKVQQLKACLHWRHSSKRAAVRDVFKSRVSAYPGFENVTPGGLKK